ncbi:16S rRNA (uracil(1498)-N(3))-methyltransferase [Spiroplasma endosymbiont of Asaphidion curtum]|uniref:RsmE family RNA methyltransferase n=1 Tax=Spiroplasma endosymbiont of Asaphidion curtum TaxID=3066281 RepID=UPI00313D6365
MQCYFAHFQDEFGNLVFNDVDTHHLVNVLRFQINDLLIVVYNGKKYQTKIIEKKPQLKVEIQKNLLENTELEIVVTLLMPLLKQDRNDWIVQKATELGVTQIIGIVLERSVTKIKQNEDKKKKMMRWQKIAKEAAQQSNRNQIPKIVDIITDVTAIIPYKSDLNLIANELASSTHSLSALMLFKSTSITFICGPEGGFSDKELEFFNFEGFNAINLGKRVLRSETAVLAFLANIGYEHEKLKEK